MQEKSYDEYEEKFRKTIVEIVERLRFDDQLVGFVKDVERLSKSSYRIKGPVKAPKKIQFEITAKQTKQDRFYRPVPIEGWAKRPSEADLVPALSGLAVRYVASFERHAIVNGLLRGIGREFTNGNTKKRVREAIEWIADNGHYPDRLLSHPLDRALLEKEGVVAPVWPFPRSLREHKSPHFYEVAEGGLEAYWIPEVKKGTMIIYEKNAIWLERTPLRVNFDDKNSPRYLIIEEERFVAPLFEEAVVKLSFKAEPS